MRKTKLRTASAVLSLALVSSALAGCTSFTGNDISAYPTSPMLTTEDVKNYYAKALDYEQVVTRSTKVYETTYTLREVDEEKQKILKEKVSSIEGLLNSNEYGTEEDLANKVEGMDSASEETKKLLAKDTFYYIKNTFDDKVLSNPTVKDIKQALGYYFVDVEYDITPMDYGKFNKMTTMVGIPGVFFERFDGTFEYKNDYVLLVALKLNNYYRDNNILCRATIGPDNELVLTEGLTPINFEKHREDNTEVATFNENELHSDSNPDADEILNAPGDATEDEEVSDIEPAADDDVDTSANEAIGNDSTDEPNNADSVADELTNEAIDALRETPTVTAEGTEIKQNYTQLVPDSRKSIIDVHQVNSAVGISLKQKAQVPDLDIIYEIPANKGAISGYGIYPAGLEGLTVFGFDRTKLAGKATLRYVFKDALDGTNEILGVNIYCINENITTGYNTSDTEVHLSDVMMSELEKMVERSDRCIVNNDIEGLMSGNVYEDIGVGILTGYKSKSTNTLKYMSTIKNVLARDVTNDSYLLDVETTVIDGSKSADAYGTYRDKYYMVVQQQGADFKIVDNLRMSRTVVKEPQITTDSVLAKRLIALSLSDKVDEDTQNSILELLTNLYEASSHRVMSETADGVYHSYYDKDKVVKTCIRECFDKDTKLLSSSQYNYLVSQLQSDLIDKGLNVRGTMYGTVINWIGAYADQAEFVADEMIVYEGQNEAKYFRVYYLVSNFNDKWVIDERRILDEEDISGSDIDAKLGAIKNGTGVQNTNKSDEQTSDTNTEQTEGSDEQAEE